MNKDEIINLKEYFHIWGNQDFSKLNLDLLTQLFTKSDFVETKPYLYRRKLIPNDSRFKQIELVYDEDQKVKAIVWDLNITYKDLKDYFGEPIIHYEYYSETTAFAFRSKNQDIEIISTRTSGKLNQLGESFFENESETKIENPEFTFIQFSLK
ncbi:hypothetical protein [Flavobacterium sangjuense]|uniref:Uncharacterized protein n=1 Tax=Flavobacterium sangjuense TaxID=2518177 RepID=A0A4P7PTJ5_9FLAO|nr:hypothetical protein [Flavobacterium sangjuense]QBZ97570.1 hypothetical protein GS03_01062 [Flavobacterium sangjuense]